MLKTPVDLTGLFDTGQSHELGEFMSFLLQLEYRDLSHRLQRDIAQYVEGGCVETDGCLLWYLVQCLAGDFATGGWSSSHSII
ncbi:MAG: hypothetical protein EHM62_04820 [Methylococcus sp.]|nr:MAG: hypothetical protein EHM62_04820 [Methylococcus sp.]